MSIDNELKKLKKRKGKINNEIEMELKKRQFLDPDDKPSIYNSMNREKQLRNNYSEVNKKIKKLEMEKEKSIVSFTKNNQNEFINSIDSKNFLQDALSEIKINPDSKQTVKIQNTTTVSVTEDFDNGIQTTKTFTQTNTQKIQSNNGKIYRDTHIERNHELKEERDGKVINSTTITDSISSSDNYIIPGEHKQLRAQNDDFIDINVVKSKKDKNALKLEIKNEVDTLTEGIKHYKKIGNNKKMRELQSRRLFLLRKLKELN